MTALLNIKCHYPAMTIPQKAHASDAGIDLTAYAVKQKRDRIYLFDTGISAQISQGYYLEIVPRSSIINTDFMMANSIGVIDPDYRGKIFVPLRYIGENNGEKEANALLNTRIAQLLIRQLPSCEIAVVEELNTTVRGEGGFGSSGK